MMKALSPEFRLYVCPGAADSPYSHLPHSRFKDDVLDRFFHALEKFQESPKDMAQLKEAEQMIEAMELLRNTEHTEE